MAGCPVPTAIVELSQRSPGKEPSEADASAGSRKLDLGKKQRQE